MTRWLGRRCRDDGSWFDASLGKLVVTMVDQAAAAQVMTRRVESNWSSVARLSFDGPLAGWP